MKSKQPTTSKTTRQRPARRTKPGPHTPSVSAHLHERIATRAFENYERRIRQGPLDDWLQAEQEILGQKNTRMLTCRTMVDPPVRSKTDKLSPGDL